MPQEDQILKINSENINSLKQRTVIALFWKLFERGGGMAVQLIVQIVLARLLAPEQFGLLAIMLVFINVGNTIVVSGLNTALVQSETASNKDCSTVFWLSSSISLVLYIAVFFAAPAISQFYGSADLVWPLRVLGLVLIINAYNSVQVAIVQRRLEFKKVFYSSISSVVVSGTIGIVLAVLGAGLWALVAQQIFYQLISCLVLAFQVSWKPSLVFDLKRTRELFGFGWKLLVSGLLDVGYQSLSDLIIGKQFSTASLGLVSQGKKYPAAVGGILDGAIQSVMLSAVSHVQSDVEQVKRLVRRALKTSTYLIMPAMVMFASTAQSLVLVLLGEQWLPCVWFMQVYCFVYAMLPIHTSNLQALNGMGRSDLFLKLELIKKSYGIVFILLTALVLQDIYAMVASYLLTGVIGTFVNAYPNKKVIGYSYSEQLKDIFPAFILTIVAAACAWPFSLLSMPPLVTIAIQALVMTVVYLALSKLFHVEAFEYLLATVKGFMRSRG
ncbi:flippase [Paraeggerthella hongkongensis]|uniref:Flippase n=2 Tax=Paraeggerthella hongkongensis TaxID=230658 RepID=A0A3N0BDW7_9ACTN|nr:flippase [Paraeggerthella hongkongensis]